MPDDHSAVEPPLPIPNRTVKRRSADDSEHPLVKVGHRQAIHRTTPRDSLSGRFCFPLRNDPPGYFFRSNDQPMLARKPFVPSSEIRAVNRP